MQIECRDLSDYYLAENIYYISSRDKSSGPHNAHIAWQYWNGAISFDYFVTSEIWPSRWTFYFFRLAPLFQQMNLKGSWESGFPRKVEEAHTPPCLRGYTPIPLPAFIRNWFNFSNINCCNLFSVELPGPDQTVPNLQFGRNGWVAHVSHQAHHERKAPTKSKTIAIGSHV